MNVLISTSPIEFMHVEIIYNIVTEQITVVAYYHKEKSVEPFDMVRARQIFIFAIH